MLKNLGRTLGPHKTTPGILKKLRILQLHGWNNPPSFLKSNLPSSKLTKSCWKSPSFFCPSTIINWAMASIANCNRDFAAMFDKGSMHPQRLWRWQWCFPSSFRWRFPKWPVYPVKYDIQWEIFRILKWRYVNVPYFGPYFMEMFPEI